MQELSPLFLYLSRIFCKFKIVFFLCQSLSMGSLSTLETNLWFCFWIFYLELQSLQFIRPEKPDWWMGKMKCTFLFQTDGVCTNRAGTWMSCKYGYRLLVFKDLWCNAGVLCKCSGNEVYIWLWSCNNTIDPWTFIVNWTPFEHLQVRNDKLDSHVLMVFMNLRQMVP